MTTSRTLITVALSLIIQLTQAQNFQWAKQFGINNNENSNAIAVDGSGNVLTVGQFDGTVDFDPGVGTASLSAAPGGFFDCYISKLNAAGNFVWARAVNSTSGTVGMAVKTDATGNVYVTGWFMGNIDLDPGVGTATATSNGAADFFICKLDPNGNYLWGHAMGGASGFIGDKASGIALDATGNVYITGVFDSTVDFDPSPATSSTLSPIFADAFVLKLTTTGNFVWVKQFEVPGNGESRGTGITVDVANNVLTTGYFMGTVDFDPSSTATVSLTSTGNRDIFVSKLDVNGNFVWARNMGSTAMDQGSAIAVDASNNVYTTGFFNGTADFDPAAATTFTLLGNNRDVFISKLNANGNFVWAKQIGAAGPEEGNAIAIDPTGVVYTTGYFTGTVDLNPGVGTDVKTTLFNSVDIFVCRLDAAGNCDWGMQIGNDASEIGRGIATDQGSGLYLTGDFTSVVDFNPSAATYTMVDAAGGNSSDAFVVKFQVCTPQVSANSGTICAGRSFTMTASGATTYTFQGGNAVVNPTVTTTYTVAGTNTAGCISEAAVVVSVTPNPTISAGSGFICTGNSFTVNPSGANTYTIQGGNLAVSPTVTTTYTIAGTSTAGCVSAIRTVTVNVGSFTMAASPNTTVCSGTQVNLNANGTGATSFTWTSPTGSVNNANYAVTPTVSTSYTVVGRNVGNCQDTKTVQVTVTSSPTVIATGGNICSGANFTINPSGATTYTISGGNAIVSPAVSTIYTVAGSNATGCVGQTTVAVNVNTLALTTVVTNTAICSGAQVTLTAAGAVAGSYSWTSSGGVVLAQNITPSPTLSSTYTVSAKDANNCVFTRTVAVTVNALPNVTAIANPSVVCKNTRFTLSASGAETYTWSPIPSSSATAVTIAFATGTVVGSYIYSVNGTALNGCKKTATVSVVVGPCTGVDELEQHSARISVYPNPSNGKITIKGNPGTTMQLVDVLGKTLATLTLNDSGECSVTELAKGIYFIVGKESGSGFTSKIIVE